MSSICGDQRSDTTAYEPGSGSTIMGYSVCSPENLQPNNDVYFHVRSLEQIIGYASSTGDGCAQKSNTNNNAPTVTTGASFTIPKGTPFMLTATANDPDGDPITYAWEEYDKGAAVLAGQPLSDDGSRPIFRSFAPVTSPSRTFPSMQYVLNNAGNPPATYQPVATPNPDGSIPVYTGTFITGEAMTNTTRTLNFQVTVRDNRATGGGVNTAATQVNVRAEAGPFVVTAPTAGSSFQPGSTQNVMWNVANTSAAPVNAANVKSRCFHRSGRHTAPVANGSAPVFARMIIARILDFSRSFSEVACYMTNLTA
jgi:hypothetical protein